MDSRTAENKAFLENLYRKGPFERHGFVCHPQQIPPHEGPDNEFTTSTRPVEEWVPMVVENYERKCRLLEEAPNDDVPTCDIVTGTHIIAAAFGCPVHRSEDTNPCALPLVSTAEEADAVAEPDIWSAPTLYRVFELARAVQRELGPEVPLGPPDKQTGFDNACLIWEKTGIYPAMMTEEEKGAVHRLTEKCSRVLVRFIQELRKEFPTMSMSSFPRVWTPPTMAPWFSNDECGAFGPDAFEEFCLPELCRLSETFGGIGMHCCADADHQFPLFARIPGFYAFNRVPAKTGTRGLDPLMETLGGSGGPVHVLAWQPVDVTEKLIAHAPRGTRFIFTLKGADAETAREWLDRMHAATAAHAPEIS
jgi:hypothetical protein